MCQWSPRTVHAPVLGLYLIGSYGYLYLCPGYLFLYSFVQFWYLYLCFGYLIQVWCHVMRIEVVKNCLES